MNKEYLKRYAEVTAKVGLNVQKGQKVVIFSPIESAEFARMVAECCYDLQANEVIMEWIDGQSARMKFLRADESVFESYPSWKKDFYLTLSRGGAGFIHISGDDPEMYVGVDPSRMLKFVKCTNEAIKEYRDRTMSMKNQWTIVAVPTDKWAAKVFPELDIPLAKEKLWESIFKACRVDQDNVLQVWSEFKQSFIARVNFLNGHKFKKMHFKNSIGTDLEVLFHEKHIWKGCPDYTPDGVEMYVNIPSEEIFTLPYKTGVNGIVKSAMPLVYEGNIIDNFSITFKDGKAVEYSAEKGYDTLKNIIETDEGSHYLGEVALVPYESPISNMKTLFYNTLYDENASCHLALGRAYPFTLDGGDDMSQEDLNACGLNYSLRHVDFMFGTADLSITGETHDGKQVTVFENGNFVVKD